MIGGHIIDLRPAASVRQCGSRAGRARYGVLELLEDWDRSMDQLAALTDCIESSGVGDDRWRVLGAGTRMLAPFRGRQR